MKKLIFALLLLNSLNVLGFSLTPPGPSTIQQAIGGTNRNTYLSPYIYKSLMSTGQVIVVDGGNKAVNVANIVTNATSGDVIKFPAGTYWAGTNAIWVPEGVTIQGEGRDQTVFIVGNVNIFGTTDGGAFYLSDNCQLIRCSIIQTNPEQFVVASINTQRKGQVNPAQTASNLAATSTNVVLDDTRIFGAKLQSVVLDGTNTIQWTIKNSSIEVSSTTALTMGNTFGGAGEVTSPNSVYSPNNSLELVNTDLIVTNGNNTTVSGCYFTSGGSFKMFGGKIRVGRNSSSGIAFSAGLYVGKTNCTVDFWPTSIEFTGPNVASNTFGVYSGATNSIILVHPGAVTNYNDVGENNTWRFDNIAPAPTLTVSNAIASNFSATVNAGGTAEAYTVTTTNGVASVISVPVWTNTFSITYVRAPSVIGPILCGGPAVAPGNRPYISSITPSNFVVSAAASAYTIQTNQWSFMVIP